MIPAQQGTNNAQLESDLETLPDIVADTLIHWRKQSLIREKFEALAYLKFKGEDKDRTATEIKALVNSDEDRYQAMLNEIVAEGEYTRVYEKLLSAKKLAGLRTAY